MKPYSIILFALCAVTLTACGNSTSPVHVPPVGLSIIETAGTYEDEPVIRIETKAFNAGKIPIEHSSIGVVINVEDDEGNQLILRNPLIRYIAPPQQVTLEPRETVETALNLVWAYEPDGTQYRIPAGAYTVEAVFSYRWEDHPESVRVEKELPVVLE